MSPTRSSRGRAQHNVTRLIVGKPQRQGLAARLRRPLLDALVERSGNIDVFVITGEADDTAPPPAVPASATAGPVRLGRRRRRAGHRRWASRSGRSSATTDVAMLYLLAAVVVGSRVRQRPALFASVLSIAAFDFCFVPPYYTFAVHDASYVLTFAMMLAIAHHHEPPHGPHSRAGRCVPRAGAADGERLCAEPGAGGRA